MILSKRVRRAAICLAFAAAVSVFPTITLHAAVPPSVAVRQQSPEVEQIIQTLEAKATAAKGTWTTKSGRQDVPAEEWETGISDKPWYWRSDAVAPSPDAGLTLFDDGEDAYVLPYGQDNQKGGQRFQYDTLRKWEVSDYLLGHYLLHMNLLPRQFIGALGGLKIIGEEKLNSQDGEERVIHLKADPHDDPLAINDPAINLLLSGGIQHKPIIDLYYSTDKRAIIKAVIRGNHPGIQVELSVEGWDKFGTLEQWPEKIVGRTLRATLEAKPSTASQELAKPVLTSVERFTGGEDQIVETIRQKVASVAFFTPVPLDLRTCSFYMHSVATSGNASDRVALAFASFVDADVASGNEQWDTLESNIKDAGELQRLDRTLAPIAGSALIQNFKTFANKSKEERLASAQLLKRLSNTVDGTAFDASAYGTLMGWDTMRYTADTQAIVKPLTGMLLPKLASHGNVFVFEKLVNLADASKEDAVLIDPVLEGVVKEPVPATGLFGSKQDFLIVGAVRAWGLDRAKGYVNNLQWNTSATADQKQAAVLWAKAIPLAQDLENGSERFLPDVVVTYQSFDSKPIANDRTDNVYGKWLLTKAGADWLNRRLTEISKPQPAEVLMQSAKIPGADKYWAVVITESATKSVLDPQHLMGKIAPTIHAYAQTFKVPAFEVNTWVRLAQNRGLEGKYLGIELQYLNKALAAADDDVTKSQMIRIIGQTYARVKEYGKGAQAIDSLVDVVHDERQKQSLLKIADEFRAKAAAASPAASG